MTIRRRISTDQDDVDSLVTSKNHLIISPSPPSEHHDLEIGHRDRERNSTRPASRSATQQFRCGYSERQSTNNARIVGTLTGLSSLSPWHSCRRAQNHPLSDFATAFVCVKKNCALGIAMALCLLGILSMIYVLDFGTLQRSKQNASNE
jgi:hypothetical protein